jgi:AcrR family transcriptional regulator
VGAADDDHFGEGSRREINRRRALAALAASVGERGYAASSVGDVLRRARMSRRTFYDLFDNRAECFLAAYDHARRGAFARLDHHRDPDASWADHLAHTLTDVLEYLAARPDYARLLVVDSVSVGPPGVERHERTMRELAQLLTRCHPHRESAQLRLRCEASVGAVHRIVHARIVEGRARELPALAPQLARLVHELAPPGRG